MDDKPGDGAVLEAAFREHRADVYRYLLRRTGNHVDAEELTQRVFVDAASALARSRPNSVLAWLYTVAERRFIDEVRRRQRTREVPLFEADGQESIVGEGYGPDVAKAVRAAVERLPEEQRFVVVMRLFQDRPFAEIATLCGIAEAACKMRFARGLSRIRDELTEQGVTP